MARGKDGLDDEFREWAGHEMHVGDAVVTAARFGRTRVLVYPAEPGPIWRGDPPQEVGRWPCSFWRYVVQGEHSGIAMTEAVARAKGERDAWASEANRWVRPKPLRHAVGAEAEARDQRDFEAVIEEVKARFPIDMVPPGPGGPR